MTNFWSGFAKAASASTIEQWVAEAKDEKRKAGVKKEVRFSPAELSGWVAPDLMQSRWWP